MAKKGILVDMNYCTGCHACEVACKQENQFPVGICGIKIHELMMEEGLNTDRVHFDYYPHFTPTAICVPPVFPPARIPSPPAASTAAPSLSTMAISRTW